MIHQRQKNVITIYINAPVVYFKVFDAPTIWRTIFKQILTRLFSISDLLYVLREFYERDWKTSSDQRLLVFSLQAGNYWLDWRTFTEQILTKLFLISDQLCALSEFYERDWKTSLDQRLLLHIIRKVKFLSKNSILTKTPKPQHFHEFFTQFFFDNFSREINVVNS